MILKTYKYRLYPSPSQRRKLEQTANYFANIINFFGLIYAGYINGTLQRTILYN
jgi:hypothetical protein